MSRGRVSKWRNGQRQKGSHISWRYIGGDYTKLRRTWDYYRHGHMGKERNRFPRTGKFLKNFEGTRLCMRRPYFYISIQLNPCLINMIATGRTSK